MNINYLKHWLLQFYTFTLWRTLFERAKRQTVKWTTDHPPLPGNREEKTLAGVILQQEVLVRNKDLTSYHQQRFWRGQKEMGDCSPEVLPTSKDPPLGIHLGWEYMYIFLSIVSWVYLAPTCMFCISFSSERDICPWWSCGKGYAYQCREYGFTPWC